MAETTEELEYEKDAVDKILDICRTVEDSAVRQILLGLDYEVEDYEKALKKLGKTLRIGTSECAPMFNRIVNLAFLYIVSKYNSLGLSASSNCEARIQHAIHQMYNMYNVSDDVVKFVITNVALGLDASEEFLKRFEIISESGEFCRKTDEYIDIFKHIQKIRQSSFKVTDNIDNSAELLYELFKKLDFICKLRIIPSDEYVDKDSAVAPCSFKVNGKVFPSKYSLVKYKRNEFTTEYLFLRSVDDREFPNGKVALTLNYTSLGNYDTGELTKVLVVGLDFKRNPHAVRTPSSGNYDTGELTKALVDGRNFNENEPTVLTPSVGKFYSYITGDLLRKRHRMSFCNGLTGYKYYGELAAAVMDALEILTVSGDKTYTVVDNYILPVIKNNFNICKEDCVCTGDGCEFGMRDRKCNKYKCVDSEEQLITKCLIHMDTVSILTILFSVVGCKEILPQIFSQFHFDTPKSYDSLFARVNEQLDKRFSEFSGANVDNLRTKFYKKSIDYLSLDIDKSESEDIVVAQTLKPFKIRAYTDALIATLENLDKEPLDYSVNPSETVYTIGGKIDLINGLKDINTDDVKSVLRDTLKIILAYYSGLANCKGQQLNYEIQAEQTTTLKEATVKQCYADINKAFMKGVDRKMERLGPNPDFYTLFHELFEDIKDLKTDISIMLGREIVSARGLWWFVELDDEKKKCYLVERRRKDGGGGMNTVYRCDLDDDKKCAADIKKFTSRVVAILEFLRGEESRGARYACYPQVLIHTSSKINVDNTTINAFTVYDNEHYTRKKEYNVITYFAYEISKRYYYIVPKKFEKTRWITYPILIRCSEFYNRVIKENGNE